MGVEDLYTWESTLLKTLGKDVDRDYMNLLQLYFYNVNLHNGKGIDCSGFADIMMQSISRAGNLRPKHLELVRIGGAPRADIVSVNGTKTFSYPHHATSALYRGRLLAIFDPIVFAILLVGGQSMVDGPNHKYRYEPYKWRIRTLDNFSNNATAMALHGVPALDAPQTVYWRAGEYPSHAGHSWTS